MAHLAVVFGFLLATLTVTSFGLPVHPSTWNHSCGHAVRNKSNTDRPGVRHGVTKMIGVVKYQIGVAISHLKSEKKNIRAFYNEVKDLKGEVFPIDALPQKQLDWYSTKTCSLTKDERVKKSLRKFHGSLQNFSATFARLKEFRPQKNAEIRNRIVEGISAQLTQVLCEVEWTLMSLKVNISATVKEDILSKIKSRIKDPDTTNLLVKDWEAIYFYEKFLKEWDIIAKSLNNKNGCKRTTVRKTKPKRQKTKGKNHEP